ncbi:MAG TPA: MFS transporter [Blastocatellia bacterium]
MRVINAWVNVLIAALIMVATLPGRTQGLGLITEPLLRDLNVDRVSYAQINLWATLLGAIVCLPAGRIFDRLGLRITTTIITALLSLVVWQMSGLAGGIAFLFVLVLATRALGQSALSVASITVVGKAFDRSVGFAMGVYSVLLSVFFAAAFMIVGGVVRNAGWREAWSGIAFALILFVAPAALLLIREPGGASASKEDASGAAESEGLSLRDALGTSAFWVFGGATSLYGLVASGLGLFNEAVLAERGFSQETYHQFLAGTTIIALLGQLGCGLMTLRWSMQRLVAVAMFTYALALAAFPFLKTLPQLWVFAALIGFSGGMITVIFFAIWRRAYGAAHLGRIQGAAQMLTVLASAVGPLLFAKSVELTGSYMPVLRVLAVAVVLLGIAALRVRLPLISAPVEAAASTGAVK